jgi:hypothetical protein
MRVGILLIVIVAVVVLGVFGLRRRSQGAERPTDEGFAPSPTGSRSQHSIAGAHAAPLSPSLPASLDRAVHRGQITRETADAILASEHAEALARVPVGVRAPERIHRERRVAGATVEAVGYLGSVLALVGMGFLIGRSWDRIGQPARIGLFGGLALLLLIIGMLLRQEDEVVIWRLRNVVLLLSTAALAGCTAIVVVDTFDWSGEPVAISIGLVAAVYSAALWARRDRPAQHLTMMIGSTVALAAAMGWWGDSAAAGFAVLGVGALWLALARLGALPPRDLAVMLGLLASLIGPAITSGRYPDAAPAIGLAVGAVLLTIGGITREFSYTGFAVVGLLAYLTFGVAQWFGDSLQTPGVLVVAGAGLLVTTLVLVRRGKHHGPTVGPVG